MELIARAFGESPSVNINVHSSEYLPPASLASLNFGTLTLCCLCSISFSPLIDTNRINPKKHS